MLNYRNFDTTADFLEALLKSLAKQERVYLNRIRYALDRSCQTDEYFTDTLAYLAYAGFEDTYLYPGFEDYSLLAGTYPIKYLTDQYTQFTGDNPTTYVPGQSYSFYVTGNGDYSITNVALLLTVGAEAYEIVQNNDTYLVNVEIPSTVSGTLIVQSQLVGIPSNLIYPALQGVPFALGDLQFGAFAAVQYANGWYSVVDLNNDGTIGISDVNGTLALAGTLYLLRADKHLQIAVDSELYYPGLPGQQIVATITKAVEATRDLDMLHYRLTVVDVDGVPVETYDYEVGESNATEQQVEINILTAYTGSLIVTAQVVQVYNALTIIPATGGLTLETNVEKFYPGQSVTLILSADTDLMQGVIIGSIVSSQADPVPFVFNLDGSNPSTFVHEEVLNAPNDTEYGVFANYVLDNVVQVQYANGFPGNQVAVTITPNLLGNVPNTIVYSLVDDTQFTISLQPLDGIFGLPEGYLQVVSPAGTSFIVLNNGGPLASEYTFNTNQLDVSNGLPIKVIFSGT